MAAGKQVMGSKQLGVPLRHEQDLDEGKYVENAVVFDCPVNLEMPLGSNQLYNNRMRKKLERVISLLTHIHDSIFLSLELSPCMSKPYDRSSSLLFLGDPEEATFKNF